MSRYEALLIRAALVYLLLTGFLGVLFYFSPRFVAYFRVTHVHLGVLGFLLSMVMGIGYWMMPRPGGLRQERLEALTFYLLNGGLVLRLIFEPLWYYNTYWLFRQLTILSGLLVFAAILSFAYAMNSRVVTAEVVQRKRLEKQNKAN